MNLNLAALAASLGLGASAAFAREALDPITPFLFIEPSDPSRPVSLASLEELAKRSEEDPELRVIDFGEYRRSTAARHARELELERQAAREVEANPDPEDEAWGSWMIRYRLASEGGDGEDLRATSEILPLLQATGAIINEGDKNWYVCFRRYVPRKHARILARSFELITEEREAARQEAERKAAEEAAEQIAAAPAGLPMTPPLDAEAASPEEHTAPLELVQSAFPHLEWIEGITERTGLWCLEASLGGPPVLILDGWEDRVRLQLHGTLYDQEASFAPDALTPEHLRNLCAAWKRDFESLLKRQREGTSYILRDIVALTRAGAPPSDPIEDLVGDWALLASDDRTEWTLCAASALLGTLQREPHMRPLEILRGCTWAEAKAFKDLWIEESCDASQELAP